MKVQVSNTNAPVWRDITVKSNLPAELEGIHTVARNLWWSWNSDAHKLWRELDLDLWRSTGHNPLAMLETMSLDRLNEIVADKKLMKKVDAVVNAANRYLAAGGGTSNESRGTSKYLVIIGGNHAERRV